MDEFKITQSMIDAREEQFLLILDKLHSCQSKMLEGEFPDETIDYYEGVDVHMGVYGGIISVTMEREAYQKLMFSIDTDGQTLCYLYDVCNGEQILELTTSEDVCLGDFDNFSQDVEMLIEAFVCGNFHLMMAYLNKGNKNWRERMERYLYALDECPDRHNLYF